MKKLICLLIALHLTVPAIVLSTSCHQAPSTRVVQVQTLKAVGQSADAAVALSAQLYRDHRITAAQARVVADFYDAKFQPAFRVAVVAVNANLDSIASPDLMILAAQLSSLVAAYTSTP
jgi:uncharacterized protein YoaH (UPF0181 family)